MEPERQRRNSGDRRMTPNFDTKPVGFVERRTGQRRQPPKSLLHWFIGLDSMCRKASICPKFERRALGGHPGECANCEYLRLERKRLLKLRITLGLTFIVFLVSTYFTFGV